MLQRRCLRWRWARFDAWWDEILHFEVGAGGRRRRASASGWRRLDRRRLRELTSPESGHLDSLILPKWSLNHRPKRLILPKPKYSLHRRPNNNALKAHALTQVVALREALRAAQRKATRVRSLSPKPETRNPKPETLTPACAAPGGAGVRVRSTLVRLSPCWVCSWCVWCGFVGFVGFGRGLIWA